MVLMVKEKKEEIKSDVVYIEPPIPILEAMIRFFTNNMFVQKGFVNRVSLPPNDKLTSNGDKSLEVEPIKIQKKRGRKKVKKNLVDKKTPKTDSFGTFEQKMRGFDTEYEVRYS